MPSLTDYTTAYKRLSDPKRWIKIEDSDRIWVQIFQEVDLENASLTDSENKEILPAVAELITKNAPKGTRVHMREKEKCYGFVLSQQQLEILNTELAKGALAKIAGAKTS